MKCSWAIFHQPSNIHVGMPYALSSGLITTYSIIYEVLNELNVTNTNYTSLSFYNIVIIYDSNNNNNNNNNNNDK